MRVVPEFWQENQDRVDQTRPEQKDQTKKRLQKFPPMFKIHFLTSSKWPYVVVDDDAVAGENLSRVERSTGFSFYFFLAKKVAIDLPITTDKVCSE